MMANTSASTQQQQAKHDCTQALTKVNQNLHMNSEQRKKLKKKNYNRRKKQKNRALKQNSLKNLLHITKKICLLKNNYEQNQEEIDKILQLDFDEQLFYLFINKVIRHQMNSLKDKIHQITKNFCLLYRQHKAINPSEIGRLFELLQIVRHASTQIQKIINRYRKLKYTTENSQSYCHINLDLKSFRYIVTNDAHNAEFESYCQEFIEETKDKRQRYIIQEILSTFRNAKQYNDQENSDDEEEEDSCSCHCQCQDQDNSQQQMFEQKELCKKLELLQSANNLQCPQQLQTKQMRKRLKRLRKKQKMMDKKLIQQEYKKIYQTQVIIKNLNQMKIDNSQRISCWIEPNWAEKLKKLYKL